MKTASQFLAAGCVSRLPSGNFSTSTSCSWSGGATPIGSSHNAASLGLYCPSHPQGWRGGWRRGEACRRSPLHPVLSVRLRLHVASFSSSSSSSRGASHADGDVAAGGRAALDARAARPGLGLAAAQWAKQQPQVEDDAGPTRRHLHPEGGPAAVGEGRLQHGRLVAAWGGGARRQVDTRTRTMDVLEHWCQTAGQSVIIFGPVRQQ